MMINHASISRQSCCSLLVVLEVRDPTLDTYTCAPTWMDRTVGLSIDSFVAFTCSDSSSYSATLRHASTPALSGLEQLRSRRGLSMTIR